MAIDKMMDIAGSAMSAQLVRMNTTASNLANAGVVASSADGAYKAKRAEFSTILQQAAARQPGMTAGGVRVNQIIEDNTPVRQVFDPGSPQADANGYVWASNINPMQEMIDIMDASRAYENNIQVIVTGKELMIRTLDVTKA